jgi:D-serine deaminase-like pyridoxal phosphate-dependent protein
MSFPWPDVGTPIAQVATPMPLIDESRLAANIARVQDYCDAHGKTFRPHIKTHKIPAIAEQQIEAGAIGINCQKVTEAEVFADAGIDDILITYNILGETKLSKLKLLNDRVKRLTVVADSAVTIAGLAQSFTAERPLNVLIECDTGGKRCGVQTPEQVVALAEQITAAEGLKFNGILTYPSVGGAEATEKFMQQSVTLLAEKGIECLVRSSGGSPDLFLAHLVPTATEHRAGTYVYNDRSMVRAGHCSADDLAMTVLATVVSRPAKGRAILDSGSKALTSDLLGFDDYGAVLGFDGAKITSLSEEHAVVDISQCEDRFPQIGETVRVIPNHTCVITNLFDRIVFHQDGVVTRVEKVLARGTVW